MTRRGGLEPWAVLAAMVLTAIVESLLHQTSLSDDALLRAIMGSSSPRK